MRPADPRLRAFLAPARRALAGVAVAGVSGGVLVVAQAWLVAGLVVAVVRDGDVVAWGVAVAGLLAARGLVGGLGDVLASRAAAHVSAHLRRRLVTAIVAGRTPRTDADGEVAVLVTRGVSAAEPYLTRYVPAVVLAAVVPPMAVVALATQDLLSALIVVATLPLVPVFGALVGLATRDRAERQWRAMASLSGHFLDVVRGLPTLVAHRRARAQSARIAHVTERYRVASLRTLRIAFASSAVLELVATLSVALVAVTVGVRLASGGLDLRTALVVLLLAPEAYWPLRRVGAEFHAAAEGAATLERTHDMIAREPEAVTPGAPASAGLSGDLVLDRLTVTHPGRTVPALAMLSAVVPARGVTVVTGPSGCGKSTLLAALAGLLPASAITVGRSGTAGTADTALPGGTAWQEQVAWLPQRPHFVAGTLAANLRLARPHAADGELWEALRRVALEERVRTLPHGLATPLGEDGATLSAGEGARLALARVVLADRPWTLLDEPTAHLDDLTERVVCDTVQDLGRRGAVVVVSHRPALLDVADRVLALPAPPAASTRPEPPVARAHPSAPPAAAPPPSLLRADETGATRRGLLLATALGALASASGVALTVTAGWLIVQASAHPAVLTLLLAVVGVRAFGLARPVLRYVERLHAHDAALSLLARRRVQVYDALVPLVPGRLGRSGARRGDLLAAVVDDVDAVVDHELRVRHPVRQATAVTVIAGGVAVLLLPSAAGVVTATALLCGAGGFALARAGARRAEQAAVRLRAELSRQVVEAVQAADELRMWQAGGAVAGRVVSTSDALGRAARTTALRLAGARWLVLAGAGVAMALVGVLATHAVADGTVGAPVAALLVLLPLALADVLLPVADAGALAARTAAAQDRLAALEHTPPAVRDTVTTARHTSPEIEVHTARVRYERGGPLTPPLSVRLRPGERVAVVGPSGSGKSTLAALALRFVDPASGRVRLGGHDGRDLALDDVRAATGLVDDHPHVFATTLVENVRLARPGASDAEVETALRRARLGDWLEALPAGLHTWLGTGHAEVSGGERARIGVARSLLADQRVLVLDEPTAHLDHATAAELASEVLNGAGSRSVLWITHGRVGLDLADRVAVLPDPIRALSPGVEGSAAGTRPVR